MRALLWFVENPGWHEKTSSKIPRHALKVKNYALLRHWGLLESTSRDTWRATELATAFVNGKIRVRSYIITEKTEFVCFSGKMIAFDEAIRLEVDNKELETGWIK